MRTPITGVKAGDIRSEDLVARLFAKGEIGEVVHLAAKAGVRPSIEHPAIYADVNVTGTWQCAKRVALEMMAQRSGSIVNIITSAHTQISRVHIPYGPSKSFIESFTKAGAEQLKPHGVRMNALMPGGSANRRGESEPDSNPYDVMVPAALFLASDASRDVSGETFIADQYNRERGL